MPDIPLASNGVRDSTSLPKTPTGIAGLDDPQAATRAGTNAGEYVVVSVRDTGGGMPPEVVTRAFEPFFTTKEIGKRTGLGLSQVYGFAKQSDGFVTIESGTTVSIHLPRTQRDRTVSAPVEVAVSLAVERGPGTILLVEDDADVRATAAAMLLDLGYLVREAHTARAALLAADDGGIDLVFSDVIMPDGMSGIDLARELGRRPAPPPMLLTSGYTAQRVIRRSWRTGCCCFASRTRSPSSRRPSSRRSGPAW